MYIEHLKVKIIEETKSKPKIKWLVESDIPAAAICKTVHKGLALKNKTKATPEKKRAKKTEVDKKQPQISGFFKKS
jgi:hypothetical protein